MSSSPAQQTESAAQAGKGAGKAKKKIKKNITTAVAHISANFNNTIITITDPQGNTLDWSSAASLGFKGSRKSTPFAAGEAAQKVGLSVIEKYGVKVVEVRVSGPGPGRESSVRSLVTAGLKVSAIVDVTPVPHNGTKPPKKRRV